MVEVGRRRLGFDGLQRCRGGDTDVYRSQWITVNRTTHADDGLHTLGTIARGF
jgi:hypothetical protein